MRTNKNKPIIIIAVILVLLLFLFILRGDEDSWIKNEKGVWEKHGNPSNTPNQVIKQQEAIVCADYLFSLAKEKNIQLNSQCLGICGDYAIDLVNTPRTAQDDLIENQCEDYINKIIHNFIELDNQGNIVRID